MLRAWLIMASIVCATHAASAQAPDAFYKGRTIDMVIGFSPGGGYDLYARLLARHMADHIPGKPTILPKNMSGAGSRVAAAYIYNVAAKDGTVLGTVDQSISVQQALGDTSIKFDPGKFIYIGNPAAENNTVATWAASGVKTIDDVKRQEVTMGSTGSSTPAQYLMAMNALLGTKFKLIIGYPGGNDINLAMERGEVAGRSSNSWGSWKATNPEWIKDRKINILVQIGLKKAPDLPDAPLLIDLADNDRDRAALRVLSSPTTIGRPIFTTPGVPEDRVRVLRAAFDATLKDAAFVADVKQSKLELDPVSGEELQKIVSDIVNAPADVRARLKEIVSGAEQYVSGNAP